MDETLQEVCKRRERRYICNKLYKYKGNRTKVAKAAGIGLSTLYRKMAELKIKWY